jgi:ethanolamine permease
LRKKEPELERPFKVLLYPVLPVVALVIACVAFVAITIYNPMLALIYFVILAVAYGWFRFIFR